ncbi:U32 family peptidase [Candidatus Woesearchaeota archaeon]|nr:U32 family peptidase [Candidatus Woesearchaeota archaeon]
MTEIMAPAGSFESLHAAIKAGAGSVYFGVGQLNMRSRSANFKEEDLEKVAEVCKEHKVRSYLALNTIVYDEDIPLMKELCDRAKKAGVSAVIASDISAMEYACSISLEVHCSTQCNISNFDAVKFYSRYADVVVLARELSLEQINNISEHIKKEQIKGPKGERVQIELFVHGALCVSISGHCYMSLATYNHSANRGECLQNCRRAYRVTDDETGDELVIDNKYVMSPKDLCTIGFLDKIIGAGASILKIEGRGRAPEYVHTTVRAYVEAVLGVEDGSYDEDKIKKWMGQLKGVYNRGFWEGGFYLGKKLGEWSGAYGSQATKEKHYIGKVLNYFPKVGVMEIVLESMNLAKGEEMMVSGPTTGVVSFNGSVIVKDEKEVDEAKKGESITLRVPDKVRKNDKVFVIKERN